MFLKSLKEHLKNKYHSDELDLFFENNLSDEYDNNNEYINPQSILLTDVFFNQFRSSDDIIGDDKGYDNDRGYKKIK